MTLDLYQQRTGDGGGEAGGERESAPLRLGRLSPRRRGDRLAAFPGGGEVEYRSRLGDRLLVELCASVSEDHLELSAAGGANAQMTFDLFATQGFGR